MLKGFQANAIYYYALIGAIGGLVGWFAAEWLDDALLSAFGVGHGTSLRTLLKGFLLGAFLGGFIAARERSMLTDFSHGIQDGLVGACFGAVGGAVSALLGLILFDAFGGSVVGRLAGYAFFGAMVGLTEGLKWKSRDRAARGAAGGAIGGILAALIYQAFVSGAVGFVGDAVVADLIANVLEGALLGGFVATACLLANIAVLQVLDAPMGKLTGTLLGLGGRGPEDIIGSDYYVSAPIITDGDLAARHAVVRRRGRDFVISPIFEDPHRFGVKVNGVPVRGEQMLQSGDQVEVGSTLLEFHLLTDTTAVGPGGVTAPRSGGDQRDIIYMDRR